MKRKRQRKLKCIRILSMIIILGGLLSILTLKLYVNASDGSEIVIFKYDKEVSEATAYGEPVYDESLYQIVESSEGSPIVKDVRLDTDVESKLSLLAAEDEEIAQIYADKNNYPEELPMGICSLWKNQYRHFRLWPNLYGYGNFFSYQRCIRYS